MGQGGNGGAGGSAGSSSGGTNAIPVPEAGPDADGAINPDAACGTGTAQARLEPVSMFVMFDRSGSMINNQTPPTRWDSASMALTTFFQDPEAAGLAIALRFFPHDSPAVGCNNDAAAGCLGTACAQPLIPLMADPTVALPTLTAMAAPYDTLEGELVTAITNSAPTPVQMGMANQGTPTYAALDGALQWASAYQAAHPRPQQQTVVVFVTDGEPQGCDTNRANIAMLASTALMVSGIRTYTVGLAASMNGLTFLNDLAVAGGTDQAFIVEDATAATALVDALKAIQGSALSCNFPFPMQQDAGMADPDKINVDYTPGAADADAGVTPMKVPFFRVDNMAACTGADQWYYDDNMNPMQIHLCPATCDAVTAAPGEPKLDILIGCESRDPF
jgi:hypothetical protein